VGLDELMRPTAFSWWQCLLVAGVCSAAGIVAAQLEVRRHGSAVSLAIGLFAWTATAVFFVLGLARFVRQLWRTRNPKSHMGNTN